MIRAQGGNPAAPLPSARENHVVSAPRSGVLVQQRALPFGVAAWRLGAGRARQQDPVVAAAGIELHAKPGDSVTAGQPLFTLHADDPGRFDRAVDALEGAYEIAAAAALPPRPLIAARIA